MLLDAWTVWPEAARWPELWPPIWRQCSSYVCQAHRKVPAKYFRVLLWHTLHSYWTHFHHYSDFSDWLRAIGISFSYTAERSLSNVKNSIAVFRPATRSWATGQLPLPEIFKIIFSCYVQQQVITILLPSKIPAGCGPGCSIRLICMQVPEIEARLKAAWTRLNTCVVGFEVLGSIQCFFLG